MGRGGGSAQRTCTRGLVQRRTFPCLIVCSVVKSATAVFPGDSPDGLELALLLPRRQLDSTPAGVANAQSAYEAVFKGDDNRSRAQLIYGSKEKHGKAVVARRIRVVRFDLPADLSRQTRINRGQDVPSKERPAPCGRGSYCTLVCPAFRRSTYSDAWCRSSAGAPNGTSSRSGTHRGGARR